MKKSQKMSGHSCCRSEKYEDMPVPDPDENLYNDPYSKEKIYPFPERSKNVKNCKIDRNNEKK